METRGPVRLCLFSFFPSRPLLFRSLSHSLIPISSSLHFADQSNSTDYGSYDDVPGEAGSHSPDKEPAEGREGQRFVNVTVTVSVTPYMLGFRSLLECAVAMHNIVIYNVNAPASEDPELLDENGIVADPADNAFSQELFLRAGACRIAPSPSRLLSSLYFLGCFSLLPSFLLNFHSTAPRPTRVPQDQVQRPPPPPAQRP